MRNILLSAALIFYITSCTSEPSTTNTSDTSEVVEADTAVNVTDPANNRTGRLDTTAFRVAFNQFFQALQTADTATINQFIHPKYGVWFIEQPGAVPKMTQVTNIQSFKREYQDRSFFTVAQEMKQCKLTEEPFPSFDCADMNYEAGQTGYSKDGCFVWKPDKFQQSGYWDYASLTQAQIQRVKNTLPLIQKTVLHTNTSFEFHFGFIDGHWRLLFTKIIYPCSA